MTSPGLAGWFILRANLVAPFPWLGMSQLVRLATQNWSPVQGWCQAKWGSRAGKRRMHSQLGIQSHKTSLRCRRENADIRFTAGGNDSTGEAFRQWSVQRHSPAAHHGDRQAAGGRRFKNTYLESPEQFLTSFHSTGATMLYWELLLHGKTISCCR